MSGGVLIAAIAAIAPSTPAAADTSVTTVLAFAGTGDAGSGAPDVGATPGPRREEPGADCVSGGADIVELPAPQRRLGADASWRLSRGSGVTVAVIDSGVDIRNPQLATQVDAGVDTVVEGATGNADCLGQGTGVAGLIVALPMDGVGFHGVAPGARVFPVRVVGDDLTVSPGMLADGITAAVAAGASVIVVTVSTPTTSDALDAAVAAADAADVLILAPAIIAEGAVDYPYPAAYKDVLAIGAVDETGASTGEVAGDPPTIDLVAPGADVVTTLPGKGHTADLAGPVPATAYVAGVAALVRSAYPELNAAEVRRRLELTADRPGTQAPDPLVGWGVVNVEVALSAIIASEGRGGGPDSAAIVVPAPVPVVPADTTTADRAIWIFGVGGGLAVILLVLAAVVPRGRRAGWHPARSTSAG